MANISAMKIDIDTESVINTLLSGNFDIGDNPYGAMKTIINYTDSIFNSLKELEENWNKAVSEVGEHINLSKLVPDPGGDELANQATDLGDGVSGSLTGVNTYLNVRSGAGTCNQVVGSLTNGMAFEVLNETMKDDKGVTWYKVKYKDQNGNEVEGYVHENYIKFDNSAFDSSTPQTSTETGQGDSGVAGATDSSSSGVSNGITSSETSQGTSPSNLGIVELNNPNSHLNIRSTPDSNSGTSNIVGQFSNGDKINVLGEENGFYKIKTSSGDIGYISKDYVNLPINGKVPQNVVVDTPLTAKVKLENSDSSLNFRSTPNRNNNSNIIGNIKDATEVDVLERYGSWTKIKYNNQEGWVHSNYLDS